MDIPVENTTPIEPQENRLLQLFRSRFVIIGIVILVLVIALVGLLIIHSARTTTTQPQPTAQKLTITDISPADGASEISLFPTITVSFNRRLSPREQNILTLKFTPSITGYSEWTTDTMLSFKPYTKLRPTTAYTFTISGNNLSQTSSFTTKADTPLTKQEQQESQSISDKKYADYWRNVSQNYPWYDNLPLQSDTYFVFFSISKKSFIADLYPKRANPPSDAATIKKTVISELKKLDIPTTDIPIQWVVH